MTTVIIEDMIVILFVLFTLLSQKKGSENQT